MRPTLQLADSKYSNVFAAGDVVDINEARNGRSAVEQAQIVAQNIVRAIKHQELLEYQPKWWERAIKLTLGLVSDNFRPLLLIHQSLLQGYASMDRRWSVGLR